MANPPRKNWIDIVIDFFYGAIFGNIVVTVGFFKAVRGVQYFSWHPLWILLFSSAAIAGSLAALYRSQFWSSYENYSVIPPMEERLTTGSKIVLWLIFSVGIASLGLLAFFH